tara:strand:- start:4043 stop:5380 length:1338 start_codon:yes stop_codon:yes gene_type:complete
MAKKVFIKTFGCQMNQYDSNRILDIVKKIGFIETKSLDESNCFILNTCHIRDKAKEKVYHEIGRVKERFIEKDKPLVIVAGCVAQAENTEMLKREPYIDFVIGPQSYHKLNNTIKNFEKNKLREEITDFESITKFEYLSKIKNKTNKVSSYITIQEGCDKFCHFCVVPYTRGPEYSRPLNQIISEAEELIKKGSREIILLGQNVNAYCSNENGKQYKLSDLIMSLEKINELKRIRYITSHPRDMSEDLIECYANSKKLMPFIHLPIQSGSNKILKLMNRKHKVEDYIVTYKKLKKINMNIEFSSDFLIGYPGENEDDFEATLHLIKKLKFLNSYSFIFSPRPGTVASNYNLVDEQVSKERLKIIQTALFDNQKLKNKSFENRNIDVLIENEMRDKKNLFGRNEYMTSVILKGNKSLIGRVLPVKITRSNQNSLFGEIDINKIEAA